MNTCEPPGQIGHAMDTYREPETVRSCSVCELSSRSYSGSMTCFHPSRAGAKVKPWGTCDNCQEHDGEVRT